ncbi:hypothetical protein Acr_23g0000870 [Actinidia rufa]|uniref:Uncharacterized protein n=1 Tax=Actinidia rufa TaxID=165716 RepID=A0A7J0GLQ3_9ERIC|nr:hypothetical protein Acr_23g0000870 [Actinidia rufa]
MASDLAISRISSLSSLHLPGLATILLSLISPPIGLQIQPQPEMGRTGLVIMSLIQAWSCQRKPFRASHLFVPDMPWDRYTLSHLDLAQLGRLDLAQISRPELILGILFPYNCPSVRMSWINAYRGELGKLSPNGKPSSRELRAERALSKWTTFVGGEFGIHGSSGSSLLVENLHRESSDSSFQMDNLHGGKLGESLVLTGAREALSQWKTFIGRAQNRENSESSLQMDNLRGGEFGTHESSGSSLPMENLRREIKAGELGELSPNGWLCPSYPLLQGATDLGSARRWPWPPSGHPPIVYPLCAQVFWAHEGCPYEFPNCRNGCCFVMPTIVFCRCL